MSSLIFLKNLTNKFFVAFKVPVQFSPLSHFY